MSGTRDGNPPCRETRDEAQLSADDYIRLSAKEEGVLRRIDAVSDFNALTQSRGLVVMYRVFAVARGYPLGEILRQLGGGPPDPSVNLEQGRLQFQGLAQPDYHRWRTVQQALFNLNRLAFRLAIYADSGYRKAGGGAMGL
jgi:hypothetical protein